MFSNSKIYYQINKQLMILICDCDLISMCNEYKILFIEYRIDIEPF